MEIQSIIDGFYEEIMARVKLKVAAIKHFDLYFRQYDHPFVDEKGNALSPEWNRPANFFEWPHELKFDALSLRRKVCNVEFKLHLVVDVPQDVDYRTPVAVRAKGHEHTALIGQLQNALEGFNGNQATNFKHFGSIAMTGLPMLYIPNGLQIVHVLGFKTRIIVDAAKQFYTKLADLEPPIAATDQIDIEIQEV